jgi:hypothetical protein
MVDAVGRPTCDQILEMPIIKKRIKKYFDAQEQEVVS